MNRTEALRRHKARLRNLTNTQVRNLMEHAANETPLLPVEDMDRAFIDRRGGDYYY